MTSGIAIKHCTFSPGCRNYPDGFLRGSWHAAAPEIAGNYPVVSSLASLPLSGRLFVMNDFRGNFFPGHASFSMRDLRLSVHTSLRNACRKRHDQEIRP